MAATVKFLDSVSPLVLNVLLSVAGFLLTLKIIPVMCEMFKNAGLKGRDLGKKDKPEMLVINLFILDFIL